MYNRTNLTLYSRRWKGCSNDTFKNNCQVLNILNCELYFTFNVFIFNMNIKILFNKGSFNFFLSVQILYLYIQVPVLGCLVGHRTFCWLSPSECMDRGYLSFWTLKALSSFSKSSQSREWCSNTILWVWEPSGSVEGRNVCMEAVIGYVRYCFWYFLCLLSVSPSHESAILNCWKQSAWSKR